MIQAVLPDGARHPPPSVIARDCLQTSLTQNQGLVKSRQGHAHFYISWAGLSTRRSAVQPHRDHSVGHVLNAPYSEEGPLKGSERDGAGMTLAKPGSTADPVLRAEDAQSWQFCEAEAKALPVRQRVVAVGADDSPRPRCPHGLTGGQ